MGYGSAFFVTEIIDREIEEEDVSISINVDGLEM